MSTTNSPRIIPAEMRYWVLIKRDGDYYVEESSFNDPMHAVWYCYQTDVELQEHYYVYDRVKCEFIGED